MEALNKSARAGSERFCSQTRFGKWRNTVCISHFSNRRLGANDPLPSRRRFVQSFLYLVLLYNGGTKSQGGTTQFGRRCGKTPDGRTIGGFRLGFGKKRGRKEDSTEFERRRLTASATFLVFRILGGFEQPITELKTKFDKFVNSRAGTVIEVIIANQCSHWFAMTCVIRNLSQCGNAYFVIFSCLTLWSMICRPASSVRISSTEMPSSTISTSTW